MVQPKKSPVSLRIPEATMVRVEKWASEQGIPRNAAYVQLIERGLSAAGPHPGLNERPLRPVKAAPAGSEARSLGPIDALTGKPLERRGPMQKGSKPKR